MAYCASYKIQVQWGCVQEFFNGEKLHMISSVWVKPMLQLFDNATVQWNKRWDSREETSKKLLLVVLHEVSAQVNVHAV